MNKKAQPMTLYLPGKVKERIDAASESLGMSRQLVIRLACRDWLDRFETGGVTQILKDIDAGA